MAYGVTIKVGAGKNAGRILCHDFLVIGYGQHPLTATASGFTAAMSLPHSVSVNASRYALAAWVSLLGEPAPIQKWVAGSPRPPGVYLQTGQMRYPISKFFVDCFRPNTGH